MPLFFYVTIFPMREKTVAQREKAFRVKLISVVAAAGLIWGALMLHFNAVGQSMFLRSQKESAFDLSEQLDKYISKVRELTLLVVENPYIKHRLLAFPQLSNSEQLNRDAVVALESIKMSSRAAIVYIMNLDGLVIASTQYEDGKSLTGNVYTFRPYFKEALKGVSYVYAAIGVTTGQRGLYFSAPVFHHKTKKLVGVLVVKMGLEQIDQILAHCGMTAGIFGKDGVIFASTRFDWLFHSARPISPVQLSRIIDSRQFADKKLARLPFSLDESVIHEKNASFNVVLKPIAIPGWNLFTLKKKQIHFPVVSAVLATVILILFSLLILFNIINNRKKNLLELARKKAEEESLKGRQLESIGILAAGIAHDFNNHLSIILGNIFFIKEKMAPEDPNYKYLINAEKEIQHSNDLVVKLLTFTKGGWLDRVAVSPRELLAEVARAFVLSHDAALKLETAEDVLDIWCDKRPLKQALIGLVQNALEAMDFHGDVLIRSANVDNPAQELMGGEGAAPLNYPRYIRISVIDTGKGIPREILPKIFDPYFSTKDNWTQKGMGLGLTVCYSIIDKHEGFISVESDIGAGTTVHVYLPAAGFEKNIPNANER